MQPLNVKIDKKPICRQKPLHIIPSPFVLQFGSTLLFRFGVLETNFHLIKYFRSYPLYCRMKNLSPLRSYVYGLPHGTGSCQITPPLPSPSQSQVFLLWLYHFNNPANIMPCWHVFLINRIYQHRNYVTACD